MIKEVDPKKTKRAAAFELWLKAPMPMLTVFKTLDVTALVKENKKYGHKFHAMMCWCIGKSAAQTEEFYLLPVGNKLLQYDTIAVSTIVKTKEGSINTCDVPFSDKFEQFYQDYLKLTKRVYDTCQANDLSEDSMVIGTSALARFEIDGVVNIYAGIYNNPFLIWGKYRKGILKTTLPISFQFHHTQMDGTPAAQYLERLQCEINNFKG